MQGRRPYTLPSDLEQFTLHLTPTTTEPTPMRLQRLVTENPVVIFTRSSCYMCDVIKRLFYSIGVYPTVIHLEEDEIADLADFPHPTTGDGDSLAPAVFIGGDSVGGLENLVAIHLSGHLVARLVEIGALQVQGVVL